MTTEYVRDGKITRRGVLIGLTTTVLAACKPTFVTPEAVTSDPLPTPNPSDTLFTNEPEKTEGLEETGKSEKAEPPRLSTREMTTLVRYGLWDEGYREIKPSELPSATKEFLNLTNALFGYEKSDQGETKPISSEIPFPIGNEDVVNNSSVVLPQRTIRRTFEGRGDANTSWLNRDRYTIQVMSTENFPPIDGERFPNGTMFLWRGEPFLTNSQTQSEALANVLVLRGENICQSVIKHSTGEQIVTFADVNAAGKVEKYLSEDGRWIIPVTDPTVVVNDEENPMFYKLSVPVFERDIEQEGIYWQGVKLPELPEGDYRLNDIEGKLYLDNNTGQSEYELSTGEGADENVWAEVPISTAIFEPTPELTTEPPTITPFPTQEVTQAPVATPIPPIPTAETISNLPSPDNPPSPDERTFFRKTGQVWYKRDGVWSLGSMGAPGYLYHSPGSGNWRATGVITNIAGANISVAFGQNCESNFDNMSFDGGAGTLCGNGSFDFSGGRVQINWAVCDRDADLNNLGREGTIADLESGDVVYVVATPNAFQSLQGTASSIVGRQ